MPAAFDTRQKAHAYLTSKGGSKAIWTVRFAVERGGARHSLTNVYANGEYVGSLQLFVLGPALYSHGKEPGYDESSSVPLSWGKINDGLIWTYSLINTRPWGAAWICHDYSAGLFSVWGIKIKNSSATSKGLLYAGGQVIGVISSPVMGVVQGGHRAWNAAQDGWKQLQRSFETITNPSSWNWRL
jgi:hypothetical protein